MKRLFPIAVVLPMLLCMSAGCASGPNKKTQGKAAQTEKPVPHRQVGTIVMVNQTRRFVLIDTESFTPPEDGAALKSFTSGTESGVLTVSPERRPPYMVGDIVSGSPQTGDEVFE